MTRYLTAREVLYVHERLIERTGSTPGVRDVALLESLLHRPQAVSGGTDIYPTLAHKGAILMYSLVLNQLFIDGNKRLGLVCLDLFLRLNQVRLVADPDERLQFLQAVAEDTLSIDQIAAWIEEHSQPLKQPALETRRRSRGLPSRRVVITPPDAARLGLKPAE